MINTQVRKLEEDLQARKRAFDKLMQEKQDLVWSIAVAFDLPPACSTHTCQLRLLSVSPLYSYFLS